MVGSDCSDRHLRPHWSDPNNHNVQIRSDLTDRLLRPPVGSDVSDPCISDSMYQPPPRSDPMFKTLTGRILVAMHRLLKTRLIGTLADLPMNRCQPPRRYRFPVHSSIGPCATAHQKSDTIYRRARACLKSFGFNLPDPTRETFYFGSHL